MIRTKEALENVLSDGATVVRLADTAGHFHWALSDTNQPVHTQALKALIKRERVRVLASDICGEPMQYAAA